VQPLHAAGGVTRHAHTLKERHLLAHGRLDEKPATTITITASALAYCTHNTAHTRKAQEKG
jgi:hypothetical protein